MVFHHPIQVKTVQVWKAECIWMEVEDPSPNRRLRSSIFLLALAPDFEQAFLGIQPGLAIGSLGELGCDTRLDLSGKGFVPVQRGPAGFGNGAEPQALGEGAGNIATV